MAKTTPELITENNIKLGTRGTHCAWNGTHGHKNCICLRSNLWLSQWQILF